MKILRIMPNPPPFRGGMEFRVNEMSKILSKKHDITILTGGFPKNSEKKINGIKYIYFGRNPK